MSNQTNTEYPSPKRQSSKETVRIKQQQQRQKLKQNKQTNKQTKANKQKKRNKITTSKAKLGKSPTEQT